MNRGIGILLVMVLSFSTASTAQAKSVGTVFFSGPNAIKPISAIKPGGICYSFGKVVKTKKYGKLKCVRATPFYGMWRRV